MTIDRGALARADRRLLAQLRGDDGGRRLVKVPVSEAVWEVWRRYCRLARVTMGQGIAVLVARELDLDDHQPLDPLHRTSHSFASPTQRTEPP